MGALRDEKHEADDLRQEQLTDLEEKFEFKVSTVNWILGRTETGRMKEVNRERERERKGEGEGERERQRERGRGRHRERQRVRERD